MTITTFPVEKYRNCPIYYRNFGNHFEYLVIINGELFTTHFSVTPSIITKLLFLMNIETSPFSQQLIVKIIKQLRNMAETTVDYILTGETKVEDDLIV